MKKNGPVLGLAIFPLLLQKDPLCLSDEYRKPARCSGTALPSGNRRE